MLAESSRQQAYGGLMLLTVSICLASGEMVWLQVARMLGWSLTQFAAVVQRA